MISPIYFTGQAQALYNNLEDRAVPSNTPPRIIVYNLRSRPAAPDMRHTRDNADSSELVAMSLEPQRHASSIVLWPLFLDRYASAVVLDFLI